MNCLYYEHYSVSFEFHLTVKLQRALILDTQSYSVSILDTLVYSPHHKYWVRFIKTQFDSKGGNLNEFITCKGRCNKSCCQYATKHDIFRDYFIKIRVPVKCFYEYFIILIKIMFTGDVR